MAEDKQDRSEEQPQPQTPPRPPDPAADRISVQVGEGASHVAAGKNIIQIGSLTVPRWAVLCIVAALVLIVVGVGFGAWYNQRTSAGTEAVATIISSPPTPTPLPGSPVKSTWL